MPTEVSEFHIILPKGPVYDDEAVLQRFEQHMHQQFPEFRFRVIEVQNIRDPDHFMVIPFLSGGACLSGDGQILLPMPPIEILERLHADAEAFDPYAKPRLLN